MTRGFGTDIWEWLVVVILVGVAVLASLIALAFDGGRWPRRYASTLFFASLVVIWVGASLVIVVMRNHL
jgi:hypothetical protein